MNRGLAPLSDDLIRSFNGPKKEILPNGWVELRRRGGGVAEFGRTHSAASNVFPGKVA